MGGSSWRARSDAPPNKDRKYPAEVLTADEVTAVIRLCSPKAPTGIRNRALLTLLTGPGCASPKCSRCGLPTST